MEEMSWNPVAIFRTVGFDSIITLCSFQVSPCHSIVWPCLWYLPLLSSLGLMTRVMFLVSDFMHPLPKFTQPLILSIFRHFWIIIPSNLNPESGVQTYTPSQCPDPAHLIEKSYCSNCVFYDNYTCHYFPNYGEIRLGRIC